MLVTDRARRVAAAHRIAQRLLARLLMNCGDDTGLFGPHRVRVQCVRRFHRHEAEKLE